MKKLLAFLIVTALTGGIFASLAHSQAAAKYKIIVNVANPVTSIGKKELSRIYLKKVAKWNDSLDAVPMDNDASAPVREAFTRDVHNLSLAELKSYWAQRLYSSREVPPLSMSSNQGVADFIAGNKGAVSYVPADFPIDPAKLKVLTVN